MNGPRLTLVMPQYKTPKSSQVAPSGLEDLTLSVSTKDSPIKGSDSPKEDEDDVPAANFSAKQVKQLQSKSLLHKKEALFHSKEHIHESNEEHWHRHAKHGGHKKPAFGSRNVGGKHPTNHDAYDSIESFDYTSHDTLEEALLTRIFMRPDKSCCIHCSRGCFRRGVLWVMYGMIGVLVSLLVTSILLICDSILKVRVTATTDYLNEGDVTMAWIVWTGSSVGLCLVACFCVLVEPAAASSGIPGLLAFLNGVEATGGISNLTGRKTLFTSLETMAAKTIGMIASVPSGLCIGPEGPIIHISALVAHWVCIGMQELEAFAFPDHRFTAAPSEARDFLATGAACGICTAFRAPIAGVMFVVEEASSFFTTQHLEYTFLASLMAYLTIWATTDASAGETTIKFKQTTGSFCSYHDFLDYFFVGSLGIFGGVVGALFNQIVEQLNHLRVHHVNRHAWRRLFEVVFICLLTGTAAVCLPAAFSCKNEVRQVMLEDSAGCLNADDAFQLSHGAVYEPFFIEMLKAANQSGGGDCQFNGTMALRRLGGDESDGGDGCSGPDDMIVPTVNEVLENLQKYCAAESLVEGHPEERVVWIDNKGKYIHLHYAHAYTCGEGEHQYNDMAMLWLNGGVKAVKVLFQRGFPRMISASTLATFFVVYFFLAAITSGISVPAGLVVPMLLIGGSYGRLVGLGVLDLKKSMCEEYSDGGVDEELALSNLYYWSTHARWAVKSCRMPDPGTFAIIGAASFLGGSGRITVMLATVLLELTDDATMIAPVGLACICAMVVGNSINHGLYHGLIPVFNIPYLNEGPSPEAKLAKVQDVCSTKVLWLPKFCHIDEIKGLLDKCAVGDNDRYAENACTHNAFPVVNSKKDLHLVGMISRGQLEYAFVAAVKLDENTGHYVHLLKYADRSPLPVYKKTRLGRAYVLFRKLGMRHLPVIDRKGCIFGIITRKNLMGYLLTDQRGKEIIAAKRVQHRARRFLPQLHARRKKLWERYALKNPDKMYEEELQMLVTSYRLESKAWRHEDRPLTPKETSSLMGRVMKGRNGDYIVYKDLSDILVKVRRWHPQAVQAMRHKLMHQESSRHVMAASTARSRNIHGELAKRQRVRDSMKGSLDHRSFRG